MGLSAEQEMEAEWQELRLDKMQPAIPTPSEMGLLLKTAASLKRMYYVLLRLFYATGLRLSEMGALRFADILWDANCIFVRCGKGDKDRYVLVDDETLQHVRSLPGSSELDRPLFDLSDNSLRRIVHDCARASGLYAHYVQFERGLSTHSLRHAFANHSYENGLDFSLISHLLGHDHHDTTAIYLHTARRQARADYDRSDPEGRRSLAPMRMAPCPSLAREVTQSQEIQSEFSTQMQLVPGAFQLPALATPGEIGQMLEMSRPVPEHHQLIHCLYSSGIFLREALSLRGQDLRPDPPRLLVGPDRRPVFIEAGILQAAEPDTPLFSFSLEDAEAMIAGYARQAGVAQRFAAIQRTFSSHSLRTAFASHRLDAGMREITLMNQLGLRHFVCVATYLATAVRRWLPYYRASHELVLQPQLFHHAMD